MPERIPLTDGTQAWLATLKPGQQAAFIDLNNRGWSAVGQPNGQPPRITPAPNRK
jgi:hypothetical protein